jgi:predicted dehydrogenase
MPRQQHPGQQNPLRIAVVGCGAAAQLNHLPALEHIGFRPALLVEPATSRHAELSKRWSAPAIDSFADSMDDFDAAIVCVPHDLHRDVCGELLAAGKHLLVEKPLAVSAREARELRDAAGESSGSIAVAYMRRFLTVNHWTATIIRSGSLGRLRRAEIEEGDPDAWDAATPTHLTPASAGGGVLIGIGVHTLDIAAMWFGQLRPQAYSDDSLGGLEAEAQIELLTEDQVSVSVILSRIRTLSNTARLYFDSGQIRVHLHQNMVEADGAIARRFKFRSVTQTFGELYELQLRTWLDDLEQSTTSMPTAEMGLQTMELVEQCYAMRQSLTHPWDVSRPSAPDLVHG